MEKYRLIEERHVNDVDAQVYYYQHIKSGARVVKIANKDKNKTFAIAFKTEPVDDCGIPHILEHSVLNGSKKYPIKSPFDQLLKGSLSTFLNAMTGSDITMFPVASISNKDYFNLMDVYLDAVFNPLLLNDNRILKQEGWRVELFNRDDMPQYTGVVYNEMKGAYSDPLRELDFCINRSLFPDNGFGRSSGGYPKAIRTLTQEHFIDYYKKHYTPENAYVYFYGDADFSKELEILDGYLCNYDITGADFDIVPQKPFDKPKVVSGFYPASESATETTDTYLALGLAVGRNTDLKLLLALDILIDVLVNQETGTIRQAFTEAKLGSDIEVWFDNTQENVFTFVGHNCNAADAEKFKTVIMSTLKDVVNKGVDKESLAGVINRREFALREGNDAQQGLRRFLEMISAWMYGKNPIDCIENELQLNQLKTAIDEGYLENVINQYFLNNNHQVLVDFKPKAGLEAEIEQETANELKQLKDSLSDEQIDKLIADTKALAEFQNREETPEELACIPVLTKEDLNPQAENFPIVEKEIDGVKTLCYNGFTHDIIYLSALFNVDVVPMELMKYVALLGEFIGKVDTQNFSYGELDRYKKTYTGSCMPSMSSYSLYQGERKPYIQFNISGKVLTEKVDKLTYIIEEMALRSDFSDKQRIKDLLSRIFSRFDTEINSSTFYYIRNRALSYFNQSSCIEESLFGIDYYFFVKDLYKNFDNKFDEIIENFNKISKLLFCRKNLILHATVQEKDFDKLSLSLSKFIANLPNNDVEHKPWKVTPKVKNEAFTGQTKVQYVVRGFDYSQVTDFKWNGKMNVLSKILTLEFLHNAVRVRGGAYGCFSIISIDGLMSFSSYRDPNLKNTLDVYDKAVEFIENFDATDDVMLKYIIGAISAKDQPITVSQKGSVALTRYFGGRTFDDIQRERTEILNTTAQDIKNFAPLLRSFNSHNAVCVYGGEEIINENKDLFYNVIKLN